MSKNEKRCKDCINFGVCLNIDRLILFDKNQPAHCEAFIEKQIRFGNKYKAINGLIQFKHNWCMNAAETENQKKIIFRCDECKFNKDKLCLINIFIKQYGTKKQYKNAIT